MFFKIILVLLLFLFTSCPTSPPLDPSDQYEAYMIPSSPQQVSATNGYDESITLTWQAVEEATSYQVWGIESKNYGASRGETSSKGNESYNTLLERGFRFIEDTDTTSFTLDAMRGDSYVFSIIAMRNIGESASSSTKQMLYSNPSEYVEGSIAGDVRLSGIANSNSTVLYYSVDGIESILTGENLYIPVFSVEYKASSENEWRKAVIADSNDGFTRDFICTLMSSDNQLTPNTYYDFRVNMSVEREDGVILASRTSDAFTLLTDVNLLPEAIERISVTRDRSECIEISFSVPDIPQSDEQAYSSYFRIERSENGNVFDVVFEGKADSEDLTCSDGIYTYADYTAEENTSYRYRVVNGFINEEGIILWQSNSADGSLSEEAWRTWRASNANVEIEKTVENEQGIAMTRNLVFSFLYEKDIPEGMEFRLVTNRWTEDANKTTKEEEPISPESGEEGTYLFRKSIHTLDENTYQTYSFSLNSYQNDNLIASIPFDSEELIDLGKSLSPSIIKTFSASMNHVGKVCLSWQVESNVWNETYTFYVDEVKYEKNVVIEKYGNQRYTYLETEDDQEHEYRIEVEGNIGNVHAFQIYPHAVRGRTLLTPTGLTASDGERTDGITVTFDNLEDDEIIYELEYSEDDGDSWNGLDAKADGTFFLSAKNSKEDGRTILFRLRASNKNDVDNHTQWSDMEEGSVFGPGKMELEASYESSPTSIELTWNAVTGADFYYIERDGMRLPGKVRGTSYSDDGVRELTPTATEREPLSKEFSYTVIPVKDGDEEVLAIGAESVGKLFSPPINIRSSKGELANYVHITWDDGNSSNSNTSYIVKRYTLDEDGNEVDVKTFQRTRNPFFDDTHPDGKSYYTVQAVEMEKDITSLFQNGFNVEKNIFKEEEDANLGYPLASIGAPVIRTEIDENGYLKPYVQIIWERVDGADKYRIEPVINNKDSGTAREDEPLVLDITGLEYNPESTELITNGYSPDQAGYLAYDPVMKEYTYNDNSGTMRTTVNISGYNMTAVHGGEESESALTRSTVYRMPRLDEMISLANEMIYKALHDADGSSVINGDWLHYGTSDVYYNYPSDENPKLAIRVPASLITFKETGDITFTSYDEGPGQISGSFISTTAEGNVADRVNPLYELQEGSITISIPSITTATGEIGNFKAADITYPAITVNSINETVTYSVLRDGETKSVNDSSHISRPF